MCVYISIIISNKTSTILNELYLNLKMF